MAMISTRGRYALRILLDLAEHQGESDYLPLKEVAERQEISEKYLESIVKSLVQAKILKGSRGKGGADAASLKALFAQKAKNLLDAGVKIEQVNGQKTLFTIQPADGSYKVNFGEAEFENYFKNFLRPQLVDMIF